MWLTVAVNDKSKNMQETYGVFYRTLEKKNNNNNNNKKKKKKKKKIANRPQPFVNLSTRKIKFIKVAIGNKQHKK